MEIQAKSILQKSGIPGVDYVINPYRGCVHGCVYCYARFMQRFIGAERPWGRFLDVKINAVQVLESELAKRRLKSGEVVFLSSVTDPYLAIEERYQLTRRLLEVLLKRRVSLSILTKSDLVLRDRDLFRQFDSCDVGLSLMTVDDQAAQRLELHAPSPSRRIEALRLLKQEGIHTYAFISPYLPGLSDLGALIESLSGLVDELGVEAINMAGLKGALVERALGRAYPQDLEHFRRCVKDGAYWNNLERKARQLCQNRGIEFMGLFRH